MNWDQLEGNWKEFEGSARAHWSKLTESDWSTITGKREKLAGWIQERYGIAKADAEKQVEAWASALQDIAATSKAR